MPNKEEPFAVPTEVAQIAEKLEGGGFEAYLVGGCVRDLFLGKKPEDWDIATNARPKQIVSLFPKTFYENEYGTVGVINEEAGDQTLTVVEVTPYRLEAGYSDRRRPDRITFSDKLEDDLKRRDFTVNAIALRLIKDKNLRSGLYKGQIVDLYNGREDIKKKIIRAVGDPDERFSEDALRLLRAIRLAAELGFTLNITTEQAIKRNAHLLKEISKERIRDEFIRIVASDRPMDGFILSKNLGLLGYIVTELEKCVGISQNKAHAYDVWEHLLRTLQHGAKKKFPLEVRLAALFHDIAKPMTRQFSEEKKDWTFFGHDVIGSRVTRNILSRLRFPVKTVETVEKLVRWHMFFSDTEVITHSAVRRLLAKVSTDQIWNLMNLRVCDRIGTGRPKENPYRLRKYKAMVEEVLRDPISVSMLQIDGSVIMKICNLQSGPKIGLILHALLEEVLDDPSKNTSGYLMGKALELSKLPQEKLKELGEKGKQKKIAEEEKHVKEIREKYWVK